MDRREGPMGWSECQIYLRFSGILEIEIGHPEKHRYLNLVNYVVLPMVLDTGTVCLLRTVK